ncbi:MAG: hypothetical protein GY711_30955 [bacterium]|nr:hypothetical protein [bacterium]
MLLRQFPVALVLILLGSCGEVGTTPLDPGPPPPAPGASAPNASGALLERVVVLGASASAGFLLTTDLGEALDAAVTTEHEPVLCLADPWFFTNPEKVAERQVERALAANPTLVIAFDFLFWFGYGNLPSTDARLARLEKGIELLERFDCPVVAAGFPDMSAAVGKVLRAAQMPDPESLARLDVRAQEWIASRGLVYGAALPQWIEELRGGQLTVAGKHWPENPAQALLQDDELHPTLAGQAALAVGLLETVAKVRADLAGSAIVLDPGRVLAQLEARVATQASEK